MLKTHITKIWPKMAQPALFLNTSCSFISDVLWEKKDAKRQICKNNSWCINLETNENDGYKKKWWINVFFSYYNFIWCHSSIATFHDPFSCNWLRLGDRYILCRLLINSELTRGIAFINLEKDWHSLTCANISSSDSVKEYGLYIYLFALTVIKYGLCKFGNIV